MEEGEFGFGEESGRLRRCCGEGGELLKDSAKVGFGGHCSIGICGREMSRLRGVDLSFGWDIMNGKYGSEAGLSLAIASGVFGPNGPQGSR